MNILDGNKIGVVIIGRNEGQRLLKCFASIHDVKNVVYVDSGSTDGSHAAAERLGFSVVDLDATQPFTAARARNKGFEILRKQKPDIRWVQFVDGDCEVFSGWIEEALAFIQKRTDVAVVCGRRRERSPARSIYNRLCDLEWDTSIGETQACGGDFLVRKAAFDAVGGFTGRLIAGEEPEFCLRLRQAGWKIFRIDADMTKHDAAIRHFWQWWKRAVRSGYGFIQVAGLHAQSPSGIWKREVGRAILLGGVVPAFIILGSFVTPFVLMGVLIYPLHILSVALRNTAKVRQSWAYPLFMTLAKFAEFQGIMLYVWRKWRGQVPQVIEYK